MQLRRQVPGAAAPVIAGYFERPFLVVNTNALVAGLTAAIEDQSVRHLAIAGGTDQFCDATPILMRPARSRRVLRASLD